LHGPSDAPPVWTNTRVRRYDAWYAHITLGHARYRVLDHAPSSRSHKGDAVADADLDSLIPLTTRSAAFFASLVLAACLGRRHTLARSAFHRRHQDQARQALLQMARMPQSGGPP
jgi:hypothetical protein